MENTEKFRGATNGIILFILLGGDRHTDELKEIIDEKFSEVKIGTLYSIIARMKTQGHIAEYRASSSDGSRRKYYKITDLGKTIYEDEYSRLFIGYDLITVQPEIPEEKPAPAEPLHEEPKFIEDDVYLKYVKKAELLEEEPEIDFSAVKVEKVKEDTKPEVNEDTAPIFDTTEEELPAHEVDYDSVVSSNYEYKSVLNQLFPKFKDNFDDFEEEYNYNTFTQEEPKIETTTPVSTANLNTLFEISEKENIKIRTSVDTNRYQGAKILDNKLRFHSAFITSVFAIIEFLLLTFIFSSAVNLSSKALITISIIFGAFTLVLGLIYAIKRSHTVKDLPKLINSLEIALVLTISAVIISICVASIGGVNLYNFGEIYYSIIIPSVMAMNIPIYVAIVHFLSKLDFYQAI